VNSREQIGSRRCKLLRVANLGTKDQVWNPILYAATAMIAESEERTVIAAALSLQYGFNRSRVR
jgi:hypothetical protein